MTARDDRAPAEGRCPHCGDRLLPTLVQEPPPVTGPLLAETPVAPRCPSCSDRADVF